MNQKNQNNWYIIDLSDKVLGRSASKIAKVLIGKNSTDYAPNKEAGNYVIAVNAANIVLTGNKENSKKYYKHTGYLGNLRTVEYKDLLKNAPEKVVISAVSGMLPKNKLKDKLLKKLKVYPNQDHPHMNIKATELS